MDDEIKRNLPAQYYRSLRMPKGETRDSSDGLYSGSVVKTQFGRRVRAQRTYPRKIQD